jgi:hypothetical protein
MNMFGRKNSDEWLLKKFSGDIGYPLANKIFKIVLCMPLYKVLNKLFGVYKGSQKHNLNIKSTEL